MKTEGGRGGENGERHEESRVVCPGKMEGMIGIVITSRRENVTWPRDGV